MSSLREAFVSWLKVGVMEQASRSFKTGIRAFSFVALYFQVNTGVCVLCLVLAGLRRSYLR